MTDPNDPSVTDGVRTSAVTPEESATEMTAAEQYAALEPPLPDWDVLTMAEIAAVIRAKKRRLPEIDEHGIPRHLSWLYEAGDADMLELIRDWHERMCQVYGAENIKPLSTRMVRTGRKFIMRWMRNNQVDYFEPVDCEVCGERFHPQAVTAATTARYCSSKCRQKAYRQRKAVK